MPQLRGRQRKQYSECTERLASLYAQTKKTRREVLVLYREITDISEYLESLLPKGSLSQALETAADPAEDEAEQDAPADGTVE